MAAERFCGASPVFAQATTPIHDRLVHHPKGVCANTPNGRFEPAPAPSNMHCMRVPVSAKKRSARSVCRLLGLGFMVLMAGACGKKSESNVLQGDSPVPASVDPYNPGQDPLAQQMRISMNQMNLQLQKFLATRQRLPTNFEEFKRTAEGVPFPPSGKEWAIDSETRTIKLVPAK
jgi:hypothetical protein